MPSARSRDHLPALDGLRALAVLLVLWQHLPRTALGDAGAVALIRPGYLGVDVFFVLSGFLITRILLSERERGVPLRWFLLRRFLRIFPIYYLTLVVVVFVHPGPELPWCFAYLSNVYFILHPSTGVLQHTWSLAVEEHFYLAWPLVVGLLPVRMGARFLALVIIPLAVVSALVIIGWDGGLESDIDEVRGVQYFSLCRFASLGAGALCAYGEEWVRSGRRAVRRVVVLLFASALMVWDKTLYVLLPFGLGLDPGLPHGLVPLCRMISTALFSSGALLLVLNGSSRGALATCLSWRPLRFIGRISYGLYLYHLPVFRWLGGHGITDAALALAATFAIAALSFTAIERPLLKIAARFR